MNTGKFEDAIMVYHKMVPDLFCERCLQYAEKICTERLATTGGDKQYRNVHGKTLTQKTVSEQIYFKKVYDEVFNFYQQYKIFFPQVAATRLTQVDFLKYTPGGKYLFHTDDGAASPRSLSIIINLNEDYEGSDLVFGNQLLNKEIKRVALKKGTLVAFPSNFLYPHTIEPLIKGTRYSIVAWLS
jgi:predicted 2-oxoglutarate/Fe(II)-dependent dioxygenase YbiX